MAVPAGSKGSWGEKIKKKQTPRVKALKDDVCLERVRSTQARSSSNATEMKPAETFKKTLSANSAKAHSLQKGRYSSTCLIH